MGKQIETCSAETANLMESEADFRLTERDAEVPLLRYTQIQITCGRLPLKSLRLD